MPRLCHDFATIESVAKKGPWVKGFEAFATIATIFHTLRKKESVGSFADTTNLRRTLFCDLAPVNRGNRGKHQELGLETNDQRNVGNRGNRGIE